VESVAYKLQLPEGTKLHDVFHVNQLKKHIGTKAVPNSKLPGLAAEGKIKAFPANILQRRRISRSAGDYDIAVEQWLIHWENISKEEATWEDVKFIKAAFPTFKPGSLVSASR
jgi:hypothetical protein